MSCLTHHISGERSQRLRRSRRINKWTPIVNTEELDLPIRGYVYS